MKKRLRTTIAGMTLALIAALAVPLAAADSPGKAEPEAKLVVTAYYKTDTGKLPLAGVQVTAVIAGVGAMAQCTNANGKTTFVSEVGAEVTILAMGPEDEPGFCTNGAYLNPDNGYKMFLVFYKNHQGVRIFDPIHLDDNRQAVKLVAKTPNAQARVCHGLKVTQLGTKGDDIITGTEDPDTINARGGNDTVYGLGGNDAICGGPGEDDLYGGPGLDVLRGEGSSDLLDGGDGDDLLFGGKGKDVCINGAILDSCNE